MTIILKTLIRTNQALLSKAPRNTMARLAVSCAQSACLRCGASRGTHSHLLLRLIRSRSVNASWFED